MLNAHSMKKDLYEKIAQPNGTFAIVAIDQRESLRTMLSVNQKTQVTDKNLVDFKIAVAKILSPHASAMLFDQDFGLKAVDVATKVAPNCGIIISADKLIQKPGEAVTETELDYKVDPKIVLQLGGVAMKFLLLWRGKQNADQCISLANEFMSRCNSTGLLGIVEVMVRNPDYLHPSEWDREAALIEAARELSHVNPDLYKTEVPFFGKGDPTEIILKSESITNVLSCPWVVLSSGVETKQFPTSVELACRGGAYGFLAGRGIWKDSISDNALEYQSLLKSNSVPRLTYIKSIIDANARSWQQVVHFDS